MFLYRYICICGCKEAAQIKNFFFAWDFDRFEPTFLDGFEKLFRSEKDSITIDRLSNPSHLDRGSVQLVSIQIVWSIDWSTNHELIGINHLNIYKLLINQVRKFAFGSKLSSFFGLKCDRSSFGSIRLDREPHTNFLTLKYTQVFS